MTIFRSRFRVLGPTFGVVVLVLVGGVVWQKRTTLTSWIREQPFRSILPSALPVAHDFPTPVLKLIPYVSPSFPSPSPILTGDINLNVPFQSQAPFRNWAQPYQDACEEAAIIMVERSLRGVTLSKEEMKTEILRMVDFQNKEYETFHNTNAKETAQLAEAFYPNVRAEVRYDVTVNDLKTLLYEGHPIIILVNGRKLGNPFYTQPGPDKHALVLKGIKDDKFITNDPGIGRGNDFLFPITTVFTATIDYDGRVPGTGKKAAIILTERAF